MRFNFHLYKDFGSRFMTEVEDLTLHYHAFSDISEDDLDTIYSLIPLENILESIIEDQEFGEFVQGIAQGKKWDFRGYFSSHLEKNFQQHIEEAFDDVKAEREIWGNHVQCDYLAA